MQITVGDFIEYLKEYDPNATIKFAIESRNGITKVADYGFISISTKEVHGSEIVIHPYISEEYYE